MSRTVNVNETSKELPEPLSFFHSSLPPNVKNSQPQGRNEFFLNGWILCCARAQAGEQHRNPGGLCHRLIPKITDKLVLISLLGNFSGSLNIYHLGTKLYFFTRQGNGTDRGPQNKTKSEKGKKLQSEAAKEMRAGFPGLVDM